MSFKKHYLKYVVGGIVIFGLAVAVIVLAVEVARLSDELNNKNPEEPWKTNYRLPEQLIPDYYVVNIHPNMETSKFTGSMFLYVDINGGSLNYLPIHQKGLAITNPTIASVDKINGRVLRNIEVASYLEVPENEFFVILPKEALAPGKYKVSLEFSGSLDQPELVGIYSSEYAVSQSGSEEKRKLVTSKFEPTYARRAFPCLDEPDKKATFKISLVKPKFENDKWSALSNMNVESTKPGPGENEETVTFNFSEKMSTYLAVFIVSEFTHEEAIAQNSNGQQFPVRVYGREFPDLTESKLTYPLDVAKNVVEYYITFFGIDYPLPKLDLIGIPDFVSGAMENWGLITFRETNLLVDEKNDAISNIQQVGSVISHEIAHMWFGNLVTMKWWDDLWLNEGFASFMEYKALDNYKSDYKMLDQFLVSDLQPVLALDAQLSSHPIIQPVAHPDQITEIFDTITYSKGCSVIRMLEGILGEKVFQTGVSEYLKTFKYSNAVTQDLWKSLTAAASTAGLGIDVATVMDTWTLQMGFPLINVSYDATSKIATVKQSRFFGSPNAKKSAAKASPFNYAWEVPLTYFTHDDQDNAKKQWLKKDQQSVNIPIDTPNFKFNSRQIGFYRVNYDVETWKKLINTLNDKTITYSTDRSSLIDDVFSLADGQYVEYSLALDLLLYVKKEEDYVPWSTAANKLLKLLPFMRDRPAELNFKKLAKDLVAERYDALTWNAGADEPHLTKRLRSTILNLACSCDNADCLAGAAEPFKSWIADENAKGDVNVRQQMYNFGMQSEGHKDTNWETVWARYLKEKDPQEKLKLMTSLTYVSSTYHLNLYLERAKNESYVRGQDYFSVLQYMSDNPLGSSIVWNFVRDQWQYLVDRFTLNSRSLGRLIPRITQNFNTQTRLDEMKDFFAKYPDAGAGASARAQALEKVEANIQWVSLYYSDIEKWLETYSSANP
ncbi:aminopeptidase A-like isoform X1 [Cloeon dipterum]|uniref:aminopeptidase A-like isoform X1 n=1 Tax=Cloeon dipterum TaxID=197152 RepID=UPI00321FFD3F